MISTLLLSAASVFAPQDGCPFQSSIMNTDMTKTAYTTEVDDIVGVAANAGKFNTLLAAAKAAGLVDVLKGDANLTVFAPTDAAFAKLPEGTVENLLKPENKDALVAILTYHVVPGKVMSSEVLKNSFVNTVNGQRPAISKQNGKAMIDKAAIVATDIKASNGVIHVIDNVILPEQKNIVDVAVSAGSFKTLAAALTAADLVGTLQGKGPFTVFAPTDEAFAKLPKGTVENLLKPENKEMLQKILLFHVTPGRVHSEQAAKVTEAPTAAGVPVSIVSSGNGLKVGGSNVTAADIKASNGVIHVIDTVMIPE